MNDKTAVINKDDLRELIADLTSYDRSNQSNFWGTIQDTLKEHTKSLDDHTGTIALIHTDMALMKHSQARLEENLCKVLEQVTKTNGRVNGHDKEIDTTKGWIKGVGAMILIVISLSITIFELRLGSVVKAVDGLQEMLISHVKSNGQESTNK